MTLRELNEQIFKSALRKDAGAVKFVRLGSKSVLCWASTVCIQGEPGDSTGWLNSFNAKQMSSEHYWIEGN